MEYIHTSNGMVSLHVNKKRNNNENTIKVMIELLPITQNHPVSVPSFFDYPSVYYDVIHQLYCPHMYRCYLCLTITS